MQEFKKQKKLSASKSITQWWISRLCGDEEDFNNLTCLTITTKNNLK